MAQAPVAVRDLYLTDEPAEAATLLDKAIAGCAADDVEEIRSLGRTLATQPMVNLAGADPYLLMKRMGHSSITVTYDRYAKLFPERDAEITSGLDAAYRRATATPSETETTADVVALR